MKKLLGVLYRIFLMPYLERDRYFEELCDETEKECNLIALTHLMQSKK